MSDLIATMPYNMPSRSRGAAANGAFIDEMAMAYIKAGGKPYDQVVNEQRERREREREQRRFEEEMLKQKAYLADRTANQDARLRRLNESATADLTGERDQRLYEQQMGRLDDEQIQAQEMSRMQALQQAERDRALHGYGQEDTGQKAAIQRFRDEMLYDQQMGRDRALHGYGQDDALLQAQLQLKRIKDEYGLKDKSRVDALLDQHRSMGWQPDPKWQGILDGADQLQMNALDAFQKQRISKDQLEQALERAEDMRRRIPLVPPKGENPSQGFIPVPGGNGYIYRDPMTGKAIPIPNRQSSQGGGQAQKPLIAPDKAFANLQAARQRAAEEFDMSQPIQNTPLTNEQALDQAKKRRSFINTATDEQRAALLLSQGKTAAELYQAGISPATIEQLAVDGLFDAEDAEASQYEGMTPEANGEYDPMASEPAMSPQQPRMQQQPPMSLGPATPPPQPMMEQPRAQAPDPAAFGQLLEQVRQKSPQVLQVMQIAAQSQNPEAIQIAKTVVSVLGQHGGDMPPTGHPDRRALISAMQRLREMGIQAAPPTSVDMGDRAIPRLGR